MIIQSRALTLVPLVVAVLCLCTFRGKDARSWPSLPKEMASVTPVFVSLFPSGPDAAILSSAIPHAFEGKN